MKTRDKEEENCPPFSNHFLFGYQQPYHKSNILQQAFLAHLVLYVTKGYQPLSFVENPWLWHLVLQQYGHLQFSSRCQIVIEVLPIMVENQGALLHNLSPFHYALPLKLK
jgi:hypothetical protein